MVTMSSGLTSTNAPRALGPALVWPSTRRPRTRPAEATEATLTKSRRLTFTISMSHLLRRAMDRSSDALVRPAATEIAVHGLVDVAVARFLLLHQQPGRGHDLAGLAVAALRHVLGDPRFLQRVRERRREAFDGDDLARLDVGQLRAAGTNGLAVREHRARPAQATAAAELRAGHSELVAENPEERGVGWGRDLMRLAVHCQFHGRSLCGYQLSVVSCRAG